MIPRLTEKGVQFITQQECEADWRQLLEVAERLNSTQDGTEKVAACMQVFGRAAHSVLDRVRGIRK
jgi:hypothetical protein